MRTLLFVLCLVVTAVPLVAQTRFEQTKRDSNVADLGAYHALLDNYGHGDARTVQILTEWPKDRLARVFEMIHGPNDPFRPWDHRRYGWAAMLHTDAALQLSPKAETTESFWHLDAASRVLWIGTRSKKEEIAPLAQDWYYALARYFRSEVMPSVAELLLRLGRERLPNNPVVLLESGTLEELFATDYALIGIDLRGAGPEDPDVRLGSILRRRAARLADAGRWLWQAAKLDPENEIVRLHLGRVLALRHEDNEAIRVLTDLLDRTKNDAIAYLGALFIAGVRQRQARLEEAETSYRIAIARFPSGQAAYIGLSDLLQRTGKIDQSRELLFQRLDPGLGLPREPLWGYQSVPAGAPSEWLETLRSQVRR